ncbi:MAG TPA: hypothetical protein VGD87_17435 [Archangium sp.]
MRGMVVAVACLLVLGGAWFASRSLTSEESVTPAPSAPPPPSSAVPNMRVPMPAGMERRRDAMVRPPEPPAAVEAPSPSSSPSAPPKSVEEAKPSLPVEEAESPFIGASRELAYAEEILRDRSSDATKLKSAWDVLNRCLEQEPTNERCQDDLDTAKRRMSALGIEATDRGGEVNPKLVGEQQQQLRPLKK